MIKGGKTLKPSSSEYGMGLLAIYSSSRDGLWQVTISGTPVFEAGSLKLPPRWNLYSLSLWSRSRQFADPYALELLTRGS